MKTVNEAQLVKQWEEVVNLAKDLEVRIDNYGENGFCIISLDDDCCQIVLYLDRVSEIHAYLKGIYLGSNGES